jgi:hypothetical protein
MTDTITTENEAPATEEAAPANPNLTIQDLLAMAQLVQVTAQRGVWKAEELTSVGRLYDRLVGFLDASGALQRVSDEPAAPEGDATEEPNA